MDEKKNDQLFTGANAPEDNKQTSLIKSLVNLIQHEVNIALDQRVDSINLYKRVDELEILYKQMKSLKYDLIINNLERLNIKFEHVVFLQFNNPNILTNDKYVEYFYADNIFIPPLDVLYLDDSEITKKIPYKWS